MKTTLRDLIEQAPLNGFVNLKFLGEKRWDEFQVEKTTRFYEPQEIVYSWCIGGGVSMWIFPHASSSTVAFYKTEAGARRSLMRWFTKMGVSLDTPVPDTRN
jgi:hypothetical protein